MENVKNSFHFIHQIDPVMFDLMGIKIYYYGLAYTLGFLGIFFWFLKRRNKLGWQRAEVYGFSILLSLCVLVFGRAFEIVFYEWGYYRENLSQLFSYWRGGMASHGVLIGAVMGIWVFCRLRKKSFLQTADELVIPAALFLGLGRIGNFINGQIYGYVTDVWWAVQFPDAEGFRHPVALYESFKNFLIIPVLFYVRKKSFPGQGKMTAHFILWYGLLRLFSDYFREYGGEFLGLGTGQYFNLLMAVIGLWLLFAFTQRSHGTGGYRNSNDKLPSAKLGRKPEKLHLNLMRLIFAAILIFSLTIPSSWTEGVLKQYRNNKQVKHVEVYDYPKPGNCVMPDLCLSRTNSVSIYLLNAVYHVKRSMDRIAMQGPHISSGQPL